MSSLYTLLTFTDPYTHRSDSKIQTRVEQPHMDVENEPRGASEEGVEETNMPQVSASVSENRLSEPNIGRERTIISTSGVDRPHGDAGQGEFASGVKFEERQSYVSVNEGEMVEERVEMLPKISKKHHNRQTRRL
jgi:hypothetical protein